MAETGNAPVHCGETRDLVSFGKFGFKSQSRRVYERFDSFPHQVYEGGKTQGILINMPSYFNKGAEQVKAADHRVEKLPEPNRQYAKDFENYLHVLNRKPRTIGLRML